jgi:hypothetical protein
MKFILFHIINFKKKKKSWIVFNKKLILDCYFCLKSGPVFLFQIFIHMYEMKHELQKTMIQCTIILLNYIILSIIMVTITKCITGHFFILKSQLHTKTLIHQI